MSSLLLAIVEEGKADVLMQLAKQSGSSGGTILRGRGTASSSLLCLLGLGDSEKEILLTLVDDAVKSAVWDSLSHAPHTNGLLAAMPASREGSPDVSADLTWDLLQVISPGGYSDDIMAAARKAGAGGGTIVEGRGTATSDDIAFFSADLVPERELLLMLLKREQTGKVLASIERLPCLQESGAAIAFSVPVQEVVSLR